MFGCGTGTLNDANVTDSVTPTCCPCLLTAYFDLTTIAVNLDDFDLSISIGPNGSELITAWMNASSDGADLTVDFGVGISYVIQTRRINIHGLFVNHGDEIKFDYTKNSVNDRDIPYGYVMGG